MSRIFKNEKSALITRRDILLILSEFIESPEKAKYTLIKKGFENINFKIIHPSGRFILRIYKPIKYGKFIRDGQGILFEFEFMKYLRQNGIKVPRVLSTFKGELYTVVTIKSENYFAGMFEYIEGKELHPNPDQISEFATCLGKIHLLSKGFHPTYSKHSDGANDYFVWWDEFIKNGNRVKKIKLGDALESVLSRVRNEVNAEIISDIPKYIIHSDLHRENMRFRGNELVGIFDFDDCREGIFAEDISMFIHEILKHARSFNEMKKKCDLFFDGYESNRKLEKNEKSLVIYFAILKIYQLKYFDIYYNELEGLNVLKKYQKTIALINRYNVFEKLAQSYK